MLIQETPLYSLVLQMFKNLQETDSFCEQLPWNEQVLSSPKMFSAFPCLGFFQEHYPKPPKDHVLGQQFQNMLQI